MTKYIYCILLICFSFSSYSQEKSSYEVQIEVRSAIDRKPISLANVTIKGYETTKSDPDGIAYFPEVNKGIYRIEVDADGYENYVHPFSFKVTGVDDVLEILLVPLPDDRYSVKGRVIDFHDKTYLDSVEISIIIGTLQKSTFTNEWGFYDFDFKDSEIPFNKEFEISVRKPGYKQESSFLGVLYAQHIKVPQFTLRKEEVVSVDTIKEEVKKTKKPLLTILVSPEASFYLNGVEIQAQATSSFALRWNVLKNKRKLVLNAGWYLPINLKTRNTFETLSGDVRDTETEYRINSLGFLALQYYFRKKVDNRGDFFIGISSQFEKQVPTPTLISEGNLQGVRESFFRILPKFNVGISLRHNVFVFEPFFSAAYSSFESQNFVFNYFGRADAIISRSPFFQFSIGVNLGLDFINY